MPTATSLAAELKSAMGIEAELLEGDKGAFEVEADGKLVFSKFAEDRFPETDEVLGALRRI